MRETAIAPQSHPHEAHLGTDTALGLPQLQPLTPEPCNYIALAVQTETFIHLNDLSFPNFGEATHIPTKHTLEKSGPGVRPDGPVRCTGDRANQNKIPYHRLGCSSALQ